jgi:hypothetical protein
MTPYLLKTLSHTVQCLVRQVGVELGKEYKFSQESMARFF